MLKIAYFHAYWAFSCINIALVTDKKKLFIQSRRYGGESTEVSLRFPREMLKVIDDMAAHTRRPRNDILVLSLEYALENAKLENVQRQESLIEHCAALQEYDAARNDLDVATKSGDTAKKVKWDKYVHGGIPGRMGIVSVAAEGTRIVRVKPDGSVVAVEGI